MGMDKIHIQKSPRSKTKPASKKTKPIQTATDGLTRNLPFQKNESQALYLEKTTAMATTE